MTCSWDLLLVCSCEAWNHTAGSWVYTSRVDGRFHRSSRSESICDALKSRGIQTFHEGGREEQAMVGEDEVMRRKKVGMKGERWRKEGSGSGDKVVNSPRKEQLEEMTVCGRVS